MAVASNSLERALTILELVAGKSGGLANAEISRRLSIPTSSCSYVLSRLERNGYLKRDGESGRYEIGLKVMALAYGALRDLGLRQTADPALHWLSAKTGLSGLIAVLDRGRVMLLEKVESPELFKVGTLDIGVRVPAHATALGKVLLAHLTSGQVSDFVRRYGLVRCTRNTNVSENQLLQELGTVRQQGYATADEELWEGIRAVAAPVFDAYGNLCAAVSATGTTSQYAWNQPHAVIELVIVAAHEISKRTARFGCQP